MKVNAETAMATSLKAFGNKVAWPDIGGSAFAVAVFTDDGALHENDFLPCLSEAERFSASQRTVAAERRHLVLGRCFQRYFVHKVVQYPGSINDLELIHQVDSKPLCPSAPDFHLSFSSSGAVSLACATRQGPVGIDLEKRRPVANVLALSERFFGESEVRHLQGLPVADQSLAFLHHWTAKEAALKAIGKGIIHGLNSFTLVPQKQGYRLETMDKTATALQLMLAFPDVVPGHVVALVHSPEENVLT